jgi:tetratricopeptide (TPR) repeat protein
LHTHIAGTLEERFSERVESHPEILAHHCSEAGLIAQAARYWRKAGQKAIQRSANAEAIVHLTKGLDLLGTLPLTGDTIREEVRLQSSLINPLIATKGYTAPEVEKACSRARELCREIGDPPQLFTVFGGLFSVYHNRGEFRAASEMAERMLRLAKINGDPRLLMWSHYSLGVNSEAQGNFLVARAHLEQSLALYDLSQRGSYGFVQDPHATGLGLLGHVLHSLGYPEQAIKKSQEALSDAREQGEPYTLAWAIGSTAGLHVRRGEHLKGQELAIERMALCTEHGFLSMLGEGHLWCGCAMVKEGRGQEGIARIRQSLAIATTTIQSRLFELYLASAYWRTGRSEEGLSVVENSLAKMSIAGESYNILPDLYLLRGELLLTRDSCEVEAERWAYRAIEIARRNSDKTAELWATTRLARLLDKQGRRDEARSMLADIYNWFTEGFDTADLKDAKALLDELNG